MIRFNDMLVVLFRQRQPSCRDAIKNEKKKSKQAGRAGEREMAIDTETAAGNTATGTPAQMIAANAKAYGTRRFVQCRVDRE